MHLALPIIAALLCPCLTAAKEFVVRIKSPAPAQNVIVTAAVPADFPPRGVMKGHAVEVPFQTTEPGKISFVLPQVTENQEARFIVNEELGRVRSNPALTTNAARATETNGRVDLTIAGRKVFSYQGKETALPRENIKPAFKRGGYIHPVVSPSGKLVTDDYPSNHIHHHGIWFPWTKTEFEGRTPDFWNMGDLKGKVEFVELGQTWSGEVHAGFSAKHRHIDVTSGQPKAALDETWNVTLFALPKTAKPMWVFDLVSTQTCSTASPLKLPKYHYGGLGFRGNWDWNGTNKTFFLTSSGETNRIKGNETRGNWCHISGRVDGEQTGVLIMCHPENFRAPQPMRLHPSEPFFCFAPSQLGDWSIEPGKPYVSRYRFVVMDGSPDKRELGAIWQAYELAPQIEVRVE